VCAASMSSPWGATAGAPEATDTTETPSDAVMDLVVARVTVDAAPYADVSCPEATYDAAGPPGRIRKLGCVGGLALHGYCGTGAPSWP
jgi:hypothetical protein